MMLACWDCKIRRCSLWLWRGLCLGVLEKVWVLWTLMGGKFIYQTIKGPLISTRFVQSLTETLGFIEDSIEQQLLLLFNVILMPRCS